VSEELEPHSTTSRRASGSRILVRHRTVRVGLPLLLALAACHADLGPIENKYAGCYDRTCVSAPVAVPGVPPLASISAMVSHTCGLTPAGEAWCWGDNDMGQLGDGTDQPRNAPVKVAGGVRFSSISVGSLFTCAIALDRTAYCWGQGAGGALGQAAPDRCSAQQVQCAKSPLPLAGRSFTAIASGMRHVCALDPAGAAFCWGFNFLGEVGSTAYAQTIYTPTRVPGSNVFASIGAGDSFTCAVTTAGAAWCWGSGNRGELGRQVGTCGSVAGFTTVCSPVPVPVGTTASFTSLSVGNSHVCGLTPAGTALCWGDNGQGQLGSGTFDNRGAPFVAQNGMTFTAINASGAVTCGTPATGPSVCWGLNLFGKLGVGTRVELSTKPLAIQGDRHFVSFAGGQTYVCALDAAGAAYCWGSGREGQLGTGEMLP
jgi:alpha-tubulin suppressor-like RCC1 family protein